MKPLYFLLSVILFCAIASFATPDGGPLPVCPPQCPNSCVLKNTVTPTCITTALPANTTLYLVNSECVGYSNGAYTHINAEWSNNVIIGTKVTVLGTFVGDATATCSQISSQTTTTNALSEDRVCKVGVCCHWIMVTPYSKIVTNSSGYITQNAFKIMPMSDNSDF